ncbi:FAD-dependent oxidoreductase [Tundrisphaera sp. TA3]|uniref:FAD-dependent oxidoreductase n=1 Tax=Tundrisphaera sp. TA3 TaxID=3435775 RepID=UPI003EB8F5EA
MKHGREFDVLVIGAGPAGMAAAISASGDGRVVGVVDDNPDLGGQIWRGERAAPHDPEAARWFRRAYEANPVVLPGTRILARSGPDALLAEADGRVVELGFRRLVLATGARELFLPFPGWTRPNVLGAGGIQAMVKAGLPVEGRRIVVAGSGPLLLAVAALLRKRGATVAAIVEQAPLGKLVGFGLGLWSAPGKIRQAIGLRAGLGGVPFRAGWWPVEAQGPGSNDPIESVAITDGRSTRVERCDLLACGFGLVPNLELATVMGCAIDRGSVGVDDRQQTSVPGIFAAGEATGVGGVEAALVEGQIAGYAAIDRDDLARPLFAARDHARKFARSLETAFALRPELRQLARPDTIVCRCEDVRAAAIAGHSGWTDAKLQTRLGMGPCQGRVCGGAVAFLHGWSRGSIRPPIYPTSLDNLATVLAEAQ